MLKQIVPAIRSTLTLAFFTGIVFPIAITSLAQWLFPHESHGSLINANGQVIGSRIIGQTFTKPEYFHGRPSAAGSGYSGEASSGTNYGPTSKKLILGDESFLGVKQLAAQYRKENNLAPDALVPVDAVTRSSSGLDPHITPSNALLQAHRIAQARNTTDEAVEDLIKRYTAKPDCAILGEPRLNVLQLNMALDNPTAMSN